MFRESNDSILKSTQDTGEFTNRRGEEEEEEESVKAKENDERRKVEDHLSWGNGDLKLRRKIGISNYAKN